LEMVQTRVTTMRQRSEAQRERDATTAEAEPLNLPSFTHASVDTIPVGSDDRLEDDDSEHEECCPCGCECGQLALARRAARRGTSYESLSNSAASTLTARKGVKSCCATSEADSAPAPSVVVHLAQGITSPTQTKKIKAKQLCGCNCGSCKCNHIKN
jgi:hypothetical protein